MQTWAVAAVAAMAAVEGAEEGEAAGCNRYTGNPNVGSWKGWKDGPPEPGMEHHSRGLGGAGHSTVEGCAARASSRWPLHPHAH